MLTEYDTDQALATFRCGGIDPHLFLVSRWHGTEEVSQLYRFEIDLASADADIDLDTVLGRRATLSLRTQEDDILPWHGIVTELRQTHRDETYAYYRAVLEPQLALLRLFRQSRVYVHADAQSGGKPDLASIIRMVLEQAGLTQEGDPEDEFTPHYAIRIPESDLKSTRSSFICQFEETSLDFLKRRLEHAGVYFWFEQAYGREVIVFGNNRDHQPDRAIAMAWRPEGDLNPEMSAVAVSRFDHAVSVQPRGVVLRDFSVSQPSLDLTVRADVDPDAQGASDRFDALGNIEVYGSHYKKQDEGERMAAIRAEEIACQRNRYFGEARVAGLRAGYPTTLQEHFRDSLNTRYYVVRVEHEGRQSLPRQTPEQGEDGRFYHAQFTVLPVTLQYRPPRLTRTPRVVGFLSAVVMAEGEGRYAQMNEHGCYRIRFLFAPPGSGRQDEANSAWVRMATPYAGSQHGMNFPLLKGTEVLVSFLGGDPDRPVIVAAIPNEENPSIRNQDNATQPGLRTAGQNALEFEDREGQEHARLYSPAGSTTLQLGIDANRPDQSGIRAATKQHMGMTSQTYIQQVPGVYQQEIGCEGKVDVDPEARMAFQAAWDAQKARQLEQQALLPDVSEAVQLKALNAKLAARKKLMELLSHRIGVAQRDGSLDEAGLAALQKEWEKVSQGYAAMEAMLNDKANTHQKPIDLLKQLLLMEEDEAASSTQTTDTSTQKTEGDDESVKKDVSSNSVEKVVENKVLGIPTITTTCLGMQNTFTCGIVNEAVGGSFNSAVGGVQVDVLVGGLIETRGAGVFSVDLSRRKEVSLNGANWVSTSYVRQAARDEANALERRVQVVSDRLDVATRDDQVRARYRMNVDGAYSIIGGRTLPKLTFSTGTSSVALKDGVITLDSDEITFGGGNKEAKFVFDPLWGLAELEAVNITLEADREIVMKATGQAVMDGNTIRIG